MIPHKQDGDDMRVRRRRRQEKIEKGQDLWGITSAAAEIPSWTASKGILLQWERQYWNATADETLLTMGSPDDIERKAKDKAFLC